MVGMNELCMKRCCLVEVLCGVQRHPCRTRARKKLFLLVHNFLKK